jgi:hypothetical protein
MGRTININKSIFLLGKKKGELIMRIKLVYESNLCWVTSRIVEVQSNISDEDIKALFELNLGVKYDDNTCYWVVLDETVTEKEMLAYTE